jgi:hypothetical protein
VWPIRCVPRSSSLLPRSRALHSVVPSFFLFLFVGESECTAAHVQGPGPCSSRILLLSTNQLRCWSGRRLPKLTKLFVPLPHFIFSLRSSSASRLWTLSTPSYPRSRFSSLCSHPSRHAIVMAAKDPRRARRTPSRAEAGCTCVPDGVGLVCVAI